MGQRRLLARKQWVLATLSLALLVARMIARGPTDFSVAAGHRCMRDGEHRAIWAIRSTAPPSIAADSLPPSRSLPTGSISSGSGPQAREHPPVQLGLLPQIDAQADRDNCRKNGAV